MKKILNFIARLIVVDSMNCDSEAIHHAEYRANGTITLYFNSNPLKGYDKRADFNTWLAFKSAESKGRFYHAVLRS